MILKSDKQKLAERYKKGKHTDTSKWPQTDQVFEKPDLQFNSHIWQQRGYAIYDMCPSCPDQMIPLPVGKMLIKENGRYNIINE